MTPPAATRACMARPAIQTFRGVWSPQRRNRRDVDVYLPASYASGRRYPVVYMQDGQNLSDPSTAFAGTWQLDAVLCDLAERGIEPIVIGVHNTEERLAEYSPYPDRKHGGGKADSYLSFLTDTLKPRVDRLFRTRRQRSYTAIAGSSMGGLISLYAWFRRPDVFGHAAVLSPALWYGRDRVFDFIEAALLPPGRLHVDAGTAEGVTTLRDVRLLRAMLEAKGMAAGDRLSYLEARAGCHQEDAWSRRIGGALGFLLAPNVVPKNNATS
jgi:predicted alpha/beta superfamily hydrolase